MRPAVKISNFTLAVYLPVPHLAEAYLSRRYSTWRHNFPYHDAFEQAFIKFFFFFFAKESTVTVRVR